MPLPGHCRNRPPAWIGFMRPGSRIWSNFFRSASLIEAENTRLNAVWQMIQAYADLLTALGATPLVVAIPNPSYEPVTTERR